MKKFTLTNGILILMLIAGLSLMLYPSFSEWWNGRYQSRAISNYSEQINQMDNDQYKEFWESARAYNASLLERKSTFTLNKAQMATYESELDFNNSGIMGYIEIPCIDVSLGVYHGTEEAVLQVAVGHLEWSSLPTGGESTHCVLSGHRGLPSAKLFTDLDQVVVGDQFILHILDEELTYEVDQIKIVEPQEVDDLKIVQGQDLCTLVTCTPYGINSHRLLVRGHRVENAPVVIERRVTADAVQVEPLLVACFLVVPFAIVGSAVVFAFDRSANRKKKRIK